MDEQQATQQQIDQVSEEKSCSDLSLMMTK
jgi:hypothetical protein